MNKKLAKLTSRRVSRRRFLMGVGGVVGAAALSACVLPPSAAAPSAQTQATNAPEVKPTDAPTAPPQPVASGPISVKDGKGTEIKLDKPAERIIVIGEESLDFLAVLGVQPVGFGSARVKGVDTGATFERPHYFSKAQIGTPKYVGSASTPSLEAVTALKPDLIIPVGGYTEGIDKLAQVAPTFVLNVDAPGYWRETLKDIGKLVNRSAQAEAFIASYDDAVKKLAEQAAPIAAQSPNLLLVYSYSASDGTMLLGNKWNGSQPFTKLGFKVMELDGMKMENGVAPISPETVAETKADIVFVLRPKLPDGSQPKYPIDALLDSRKDTRVIYQVFDSTRASTAPYTDKQVLEEIAALVSEGNASASAAFPVTIAHKFGATEIKTEPKRMIALGFSDQDPILAFGVKPIATRFWWGDEKMAAYPWAADELGDAKPEVLNMNELNFEKIAALKPDLIVATYAGIKDKEYATLSQIAPTLAQSGDYLDYGMPWQEVTLMIGKALGQEAKAKTRVAEIETRFEAIRAKHPEYAGKSVIIGAPSEDKFGFMASQDPRSRLFAALGFKVPEAFDKIANGQFYGQISAERIDLLNTDLLVFHQLQWVKGGRAAIESDPLLSKVTTLKEGRAVFLEGELDDAFQFSSVLSLPLVLDQLMPKLEAAMAHTP